MNKIAILGAFDRYNYGDLLFPIILEKYIFNEIGNVDIEYYGLREHDLTSFGGKKTKMYKDLVESENFNNIDVLILAGGEMLGATWSEMHLCFVNNSFQSFFIRVLRKFFGMEFVDKLSNKLLLNDSITLLPWVVNNKINNSGIKVIYNTVGGSNVDRLPYKYQRYIVDSLKDVSYISVRDQKTIDMLKKIGVNRDIKLYPDSAIIMSDIFKKEYLIEKVSERTIDILDKFKQGYIIFQINKYLGINNVKIIAKQLEEVYHRIGFPTILLPIGTAPHHEDHLPLYELNKIVKTPTVFIDSQNVYDTMALIAFSKLYLGTSLHGAITSLSYAVPHAGLTKKIQKLDAFLKTWGVQGYSKCIDIEEISCEVNNLLNVDKDILVKVSEKLISLGYENFSTMKKFLL
jgi:Polysaccharide pyruvyl transferase